MSLRNAVIPAILLSTFSLVTVANGASEFPRAFVPEKIDLGDWAQIEPLYQSLLDRKIESAQELEKWLLDRSELYSCVSEEGERRYVSMTCHTDNPDLEKKYLFFVEQIEPKIKPFEQKLNQKYYDCEFRSKLDKKRFEVFDRNIAAEIELFREKNIPLETEDDVLRQNYQKINGAMSATMDGQEKTIPQLEVILEETHRARRQEAWEKIVNRRLRDQYAMNDLYDKMVKIRDEIAHNAGYDNYRDYAFKDNKRFDYTPQDCERFHTAIEKWVVPLSRKLAKLRWKALNIAPFSLRPWDMEVDPKGRAPLAPFKSADELKSGVRTILTKINPNLATIFDSMNQQGNLDLDSRKGKAPGGYCADFMEARQPFIFMNAAGLFDDVNTLLHESGHATHSYVSRMEPLYEYRMNVPLEFAEVASMSMELFGIDYLDVFFTQEEAARAKRKQLEGIINFLPWMARVDAFQHWVYTHPNHTRQERGQQWLELEKRFDARSDWSGYEKAKEMEWHRKLHFFEHPFYYIEYGIAQLGALQLWNNFKKNPEKAVNDYLAALKLGGSRPLPELFQTAGAKFDFSEETIKPLMEMLELELGKLPE